MSDAILLWCLVEGDNDYINIRISPTAYIADLKRLIKQESENTLQRVDIAKLVLRKVCPFY